MECLTPQEYRMALDFPKFRRELICIDEECINIDDLKDLKNEKAFNIKGRSKSEVLNYTGNKDYCLKQHNINMSSCSGVDIIL